MMKIFFKGKHHAQPDHHPQHAQVPMKRKLITCPGCQARDRALAAVREIRGDHLREAIRRSFPMGLGAPPLVAALPAIAAALEAVLAGERAADLVRGFNGDEIAAAAAEPQTKSPGLGEMGLGEMASSACRDAHGGGIRVIRKSGGLS